MRMSRQTMLAAVVLLTLGAAAGCGGGGDGGTDPGPGPGNGGFPASASVTAGTTDRFSPGTVDIAAGGRVTWTFQKEHTVLFAATNAPDDIPNTAEGQVGRRFPEAGRFSYTCSIHPGMSGTVIAH